MSEPQIIKDDGTIVDITDVVAQQGKHIEKLSSLLWELVDELEHNDGELQNPSRFKRQIEQMWQEMGI